MFDLRSLQILSCLYLINGKIEMTRSNIWNIAYTWRYIWLILFMCFVWFYLVPSRVLFVYHQVQSTKSSYYSNEDLTFKSQRTINTNLKMYWKDILSCGTWETESSISYTEWNNFKLPKRSKYWTRIRIYKWLVHNLNVDCRLLSVVCTDLLWRPLCQDEVISNEFTIKALPLTYNHE